MKFGILLLALLAAVSIFGSVIPQNEPVMTYVREYPDTYQLILTLQLNRVFTSWYFLLITALLCVNLLFCSVLRFNTLKMTGNPEVLSHAEPNRECTPKEMETLCGFLEQEKFRKTEYGEKAVWQRREFGRWGTFITHLGILLSVIFFALGMALPTLQDETCMPGDTIALADGTKIFVQSFSIQDDAGKLDYKSIVNVTLADGRSSGLSEVRVNHPLVIGDYSIFQQTYGTKGHITVTDREGHQDGFYIEAGDFLSADGKNGILIDNLYPGFEETEQGMRLITSVSGRYENPVYVFMTMQEGADSESMLAFPNESIELGKYTFYFDPPVEYPGLRIKHSPRIISFLLLASVILMTFGLAVTFLYPMETVVTAKDGYYVNPSKSEGLFLRIQKLLKENKEVNDV